MIHHYHFLDLNPPYHLIDLLNNLDDIITINENASIDERQKQITQRYNIIRSNLFRLEFKDIYDRLRSEMEFAAIVIGILNNANGVEDSDQVKSLLRVAARKNNLPNGTTNACVILITSFDRIKTSVFMELLYFIESHELMNIYSYKILDNLVSEYRQYKISQIIS